MKAWIDQEGLSMPCGQKVSSISESPVETFQAEELTDISSSGGNDQVALFRIKIGRYFIHTIVFLLGGNQTAEESEKWGCPLKKKAEQKQQAVGEGPNRFWLPVTPPYGVWCDHSDRPIVLFEGISFDILSKEKCGL